MYKRTYEWLAPLTIVSMAGLYFGPDFNGSRLFLAELIGSLYLAYVAGRRVHWSAGLALGWTLISAARVFGSPSSPFEQYGGGATIALDSFSAQAFLAVVLVALPITLASRRTLEQLKISFAWLGLANSALVVLEWAWRRDSVLPGGFLGNASMNACLIAITFPIALHGPLLQDWRRSFWRDRFYEVASCLPLVAIYLAQSNMALAALIAALIASCVVTYNEMDERRWVRFAVPGTAVALLIGLGALTMGHKFGQAHGRLEVWNASMLWWTHHASPWAGAGTGTYAILGPSIQSAWLHARADYFIWMHNDWLQILFEQGMIGLSFAMLLMVAAIYHAWRLGRVWLVASLVAFSVTAVGNFPLHLPTFALLLAVLLRLAFDEQRPKRKARGARC